MHIAPLGDLAPLAIFPFIAILSLLIHDRFGLIKHQEPRR